MKSGMIKNWLWAAISISIALISVDAAAQNAKPIDVGNARVADYWTGERRAKAIPRDLLIDPRGMGYLRRPDGSLQPYGHNVAAQAGPAGPTPSPFANPNGGSGDTTAPTISATDPQANATIGASYTFKASVTDASGVKSVTFKIQKAGSSVQSFTATNSGGDTWSVPLQGFTDGDWSWSIAAKDKARKGGNTATAGPFAFKVDTGGGSGGGNGDTVTNAEWTAGGAVQKAAGRLYFEMPNNAQRTGPWTGYVCSGTVATDGTSQRSVIITAAHCVYDDANKAFARNVMFIPDQAHTSASGTDLNCSNDPIGCWVPSFGVVDINWTTRTFPDNIAWDYAFYVVADSGAHRQGINSTSDILDEGTAAGSLPVSFGTVSVNDGTPGALSPDFTPALGYSFSEDPKFMYCAEDMTTEGTANWWLPGCGLSGGSSGGPWVQPMTAGSGDIISVNSWGYTNRPGMAGPKLYGTSASCVFAAATGESFPSTIPFDGEAGKALTCP
ncbi:MAG: hypothetical protein HY661_12180 [Betaproteobacteria bacterium]|nr:hypothetical protein [Betaproteobacteria bacterium]